MTPATIRGRLPHNRPSMGPISLAVAFVDIAELDEDEYGFAITIEVAEPRPAHIHPSTTIKTTDADAAIHAIEAWAPLTEQQKTAIRDLDWRQDAES